MLKFMRLFIVGSLFSTLLFCSSALLADDFSEPKALVDQSTVVLKRFINDPNMEWFNKNVKYAKAIFIVPQMIKGGFVVGGSGGSGTLIARDMKTGEWGYPAFYSMGSISVGLQIGGETSEIILMIMTEKGMDSMLTSSFKLGADASIAAGPVGGGAKAATSDIVAFAKSKGAFAGVSIEGAVIKPKAKWNALYYGKSVSAADIVIRKSVTNSQADKLIKTITDNSKVTSQTVKY